MFRLKGGQPNLKVNSQVKFSREAGNEEKK